MRRAVNITVTALISIAFVLLGAFVFTSSYLRFVETLVEFGESIAYYFCEIFGIAHKIVPGVNVPSEVVGNMIKLPDNIDGFKENTRSFFSLFVSGDNSCNAFQGVGVITSVRNRAVVRYQVAVREKQHAAQQGHRSAYRVQVYLEVYLSTIEKVRDRLSLFLTETRMDLEVLGCGVGVPL